MSLINSVISVLCLFVQSGTGAGEREYISVKRQYQFLRMMQYFNTCYYDLSSLGSAIQRPFFAMPLFDRITDLAPRVSSGKLT